MLDSRLKKYLRGHELNVVNKALLETFGKSSIQYVKPLNSGLTDALVYKIMVGGKNYILKIIRHVDPLVPDDGPYVCMKVAAGAGIAPQILYCNKNEGVYITNYIKTQFIPDYFHSLQHFYAGLTGTIRDIHNLPAFPKSVNFFDGVDQVIEAFNESDILPENATTEHFKLYSEIKKVYSTLDSDLVPSHNDLNPGNLRYDGKRFWVIDWDAAYQNDRYVDLAVAAKFFVFNEHHEKLFLQAYFESDIDKDKRSRFFLMQQVCYMYYAMVILTYADTIRSSNPVSNGNMKTPRVKELHARIRSGEFTLNSYEDQMLYGKAFFNEALFNMKLKRFEESLNQMTWQ